MKKKKFKVWGYVLNSATKESCTIEIKASSKKEAKEYFEKMGVIMTSEIY